MSATARFNCWREQNGRIRFALKNGDVRLMDVTVYEPLLALD